MKLNEYKKMYELETYYWWFVGKREILNVLFNKYLWSKNLKLLDIGCGTGANFIFFQKFCSVSGIDISEESINLCKNRGINDVHICSAEKLDFPDYSFDIVTALDLLEHLDDDIKTLREAYRVCKHGGLLFLTIPAYQFLWGEHDEALHHKRRYIKSEIKKKIEGANFRIKKISYAIVFLFFPILCFRIIRKLFVRSKEPTTSYIVPPSIINNFFILLLKIEAKFLKYLDFPFGVSIICIAQKE